VTEICHNLSLQVTNFKKCVEGGGISHSQKLNDEHFFEMNEGKYQLEN